VIAWLGPAGSWHARCISLELLSLPQRLVWLLALAAVSGLGCFQVEFEDGVIACGEAGCPSGLACGDDGLCYRDPGDGDLGPGGSPDDPGDDLPGCTALAAADPCASLPRLVRAPVIDGVPDCGPTLQPIGTIAAAPPDHGAEVALAWHPDGIYLFAVVREPELDPAHGSDPVWQGDAVEIYADDDGVIASAPSYDNPGTRQLVAAAPEAGEVERRGMIYADMQALGAWNRESLIAVATADGYVVEAVVAPAELGLVSFEAGQKIGLDLAINISRDSARNGGDDDYLGQYFLRIDATGGSPWPYDNAAALCTPELTGG
jgi:hypothetical protein